MKSELRPSYADRPSLGMLCEYLAGTAPAGPVPPEVIEAGRLAGVLDILGNAALRRYQLGDDRMTFLRLAGAGLALLEEFRSICVRLGLAGVRVVVLKGMAYALMFEQGGPTRAMSDMDLLVSPADYLRAAATLVNLGYHREVQSVALPARFEYEMAYLKGRVRVELHRGFASDPRQRVDHAGLMARAVPAGADCPGVLRLSPEDVLLHHCLHMAEHLYMQGIRPVWELRRLLLLDPPDLDAVVQRAEAWGLRRTMWCAFRLLALCFPGTLDPAASERFALPETVRWLLERQVVRPAAARLVDRPFVRRPVRIWKWTLLIDRWRDRVRYFAWLIPYAWHRVRAVRRGRRATATSPCT